MNSEVFDNITIGSFEKRFLNFMKLFSIKEIHVHYSGGGDSGGVDNIEFFHSGNPENRSKIESAISSNLEEELSTAIYQRHGGFADGGGYSVDGFVLWNSEKNFLSICGNDHYYTYNEEDGEEDEATTESWEDILYVLSDGSEIDSESNYRDYELICVYFEITNNKLAEEFHNRLLIEAIEGNESAKNYISSI